MRGRVVLPAVLQDAILDASHSAAGLRRLNIAVPSVDVQEQADQDLS